MFSRRASIPTFGYNLTSDNHFFVSLFLRFSASNPLSSSEFSEQVCRLVVALTRVYIWRKHIEKFLFMQKMAFYMLHFGVQKYEI